MQRKLSILTELLQGVVVRGKACRKLKRKYKVNDGNMNVVKGYCTKFLKNC